MRKISGSGPVGGFADRPAGQFHRDGIHAGDASARVGRDDGVAD
jgi:hypothetical protein